MINRNIKYKSVLFLFGISSLIYVFTGLGRVSAQETAPLVVAPARQSISADPGKTATFAIRFYNTASEPVTGTFKAADFIVEDNQGTPTFLEGPTILSERFSAAKWVSLSAEKGTISGSGMVAVNGTIEIPDNANPGGKYFAVFFEPDTNEDLTQKEVASVTMRLAGLVYLRVNGPISENAGVKKFSAPIFSEYGPIIITTEIENSGDYHIIPMGTISVKDMFGQEVSNVNLPEANVFPDASRITTSKIGEKWMVGRFTAVLDAKYGEESKSLTSSTSFWVFPWKLATIIALGIIIIMLLITIITNKFIKKEKKLEAELSQEKEELEKLKETLKDKIAEITPELKVEPPSSTDEKNKDK